ncbi:ABC transporter permease [Phytoactinopolyspora halotolerans]|uniref:ABC transporter permease n=1 Tax=Phytoactinopolyspora halotolerans TaxID=1981512 RepID=A0A6L9SHL3_9ACTN|nr:ABC transporter permease [Phytoactinopolyspora halotolerans]NEE04623.1 ABC transporter permease [Phytoactinopolyspora halotolerans]
MTTTMTTSRSDRVHTPAAPSLARLTGVELRKMTDTRAGVALLSIVLLSIVGLTVALLIAGEPADRSFDDFFQVAQLGVGILLPVLGILAVTSEWSQRTALTTFALEPRRPLIVAAKVAAVAVLVVAVTVVCLALAALLNVVASMTTDASGSWSLGSGLLGRAVVFQLAGVLVGVAFGLVFLSSPLAIVLYYLLPTLWSILTGLISSLEEPARWLDFSSATEPLLEETMAARDWAQLGTSMLVWFVLPLLIGLWRVTRSELK